MSAARALRSLLGITPDASASDVKLAWKTRVRQLHPDKNGNPEEFVELQEAWEAWKREGEVVEAPRRSKKRQRSKTNSPTSDTSTSSSSSNTRSSNNNNNSSSSSSSTSSMSYAEVQEILRRHEEKRRAAMQRRKKKKKKNSKNGTTGTTAVRGPSVEAMYAAHVQCGRDRRVRVKWRNGHILGRRALRRALSSHGDVESVATNTRFAIVVFARPEAAKAAVFGTHDHFECSFCLT